MSIITKKLILRAVEEKDLPLMAQWRNDPEINYYFYEYEPLSLALQKLWFENYLKHIQNDKIFIIDEKLERKTIGMVSIYHIDWRNKKAEWGRIILSKEFQGRGYGKEILKEIYKYSFEHLNLNKLSCEVYVFNEKAVKLYEKMGSKVEGLLRQHVYRHGKYQDVYVMSILKDEYFELKSKGFYDNI